MRFSVLGAGGVGLTIASRLVALGEEAFLGSRDPSSDRVQGWLGEAGPGARVGHYAQAAAFGDVLFNCTRGEESVAALRSAGSGHLSGKILVDLANPLETRPGRPPTLFTSGGDSLAERLQAAFPLARVVKALNTVTADLMVDATHLLGEHDIFVCGDDPAAKRVVEDLLERAFGWKNVVDFGGLEAARGLEAYALFWFHARRALGTAVFNVHLVR